MDTLIFGLGLAVTIVVGSALALAIIANNRAEQAATTATADVPSGVHS